MTLLSPNLAPISIAFKLFDSASHNICDFEVIMNFRYLGLKSLQPTLGKVLFRGLIGGSGLVFHPLVIRTKRQIMKNEIFMVKVVNSIVYKLLKQGSKVMVC